MPKDLKNSLWIAIPLMISGSIFAAIQGAIVKFSSTSLDPETQFFARFLIGFILISLWSAATVKPKEAPNVLEERKLGLYILRAITGGGASYLYYVALRHTTLSVATLLFMTIPIFVPLVTRIWLKIKIIHNLWWGLGLAFVGVVLVLKPTPNQFNLGMLPALGSGILGAISTVIARMLHYRASSKKIVLQYFFHCMILGLIAFLIRSLITDVVFVKTDYLPLLTLGVFGALFQLFLTFAVRFAPARVVTPFNYACILFTLLFDMLIWKELPSVLQVVGIALVIAGAILVAILFPKENHTVYVGEKKD